MVLKKHKPTTPSCRFTVLSSFDRVTRDYSEKSLTEPKRSKAGRNSAGRITIRHRGGGHKKNYRKIDFKRNKYGIPSKVAEIEYDPNRTARIALLHYADGEKRYVLAPWGLSKGDSVMSGPEAEAKIGNSLPLGLIPLGLPVHNIEMTRGRGGQLVRSAGVAGQIMSREGQYAQIKLPSGEIRLIRTECYATIGQVGNMEHGKISLGKAGRARWQGRRPTVRGVAMNPVDHPHGGGEGRSSGGGHPVSPWGLQTKGKRTRKKKKASSKFIVQRRRK